MEDLVEFKDYVLNKFLVLNKLCEFCFFAEQALHLTNESVTISHLKCFFFYREKIMIFRNNYYKYSGYSFYIDSLCLLHKSEYILKSCNIRIFSKNLNHENP